MSMYTKKLWRRIRFSSIIHPRLGSIPILCPQLHSRSHSPSPLSSPSLPRYSPGGLLNNSHIWRPFCSQSSPNIERCWNCNSLPQSDPFLVCGSCRCIQPLDPSIHYFHIFGLEMKYGIEEGSLEGKYKEWQKKLHPDLVHSKSESERAYAAEQSARVIEAYRTLSDPLSRAIYLMKLQGVHVDEEQTVSDPDLLTEIMEIREFVEEAADSQALKQIQTQVEEKMKRCSESFASAFKSQETEAALDAIRRMTYYKRANEEIIKRL